MTYLCYGVGMHYNDEHLRELERTARFAMEDVSTLPSSLWYGVVIALIEDVRECRGARDEWDAELTRAFGRLDAVREAFGRVFGDYDETPGMLTEPEAGWSDES